MSVNIDNIVEAFSYANIALSPEGYNICYTFKDDWIIQNLSSNTLATLRLLLNESSKFGMIFHKGKSISLIFLSESSDRPNQVLLSKSKPMYRDVNIEELMDRSTRSFQCAKLANAIFSGESTEIIAEILDEISPEPKKSVISYTKRGKFKVISDLTTKIARQKNFEHQIFEPDNRYTDGFAELRIPDYNDEYMVWFSGDEKDEFYELIRVCTNFEFEANVEIGHATLVFHV